MHRFLLPPERCVGPTLTLDPRDSHHAARVLRVTVGEAIEVLDGAGAVLACEVTSLERRAVTVRVTGRRRVPAPPRVRLAPALLKGRAMDFLVQKATELGAVAISPLTTARSVVQIGGAEVAAKVEGWLLTASEACKQCGNPWLPRIEGPRSVASFVAERPVGLLLVSSLRPDARRPGDVLSGEQRRLALREGVTVVLGPEGDFATEEEDALRSAGGLAIGLGPLVLRAETAAIAALAILQHELGTGAV